MEIIRKSEILRISFDIVMGLIIVCLVAVTLGNVVDLPIMILVEALVIMVTGLLVHQNSHVL